MISYALVKAGVVRAIGGAGSMDDVRPMPGETAVECAASVQVSDLCDGKTFRSAPTAPSMMALYGSSDPLFVIDRVLDAKGSQIITPGAGKALTYQAKEAELRAYRATTPLALTSLTTAMMLSQFPTLMAMVGVWAPNATTVADQRTALASMAAKVEAGIAASATRLRRADALGTKAKEDLRAAAPAARPAILSAAIAAITAI